MPWIESKLDGWCAECGGQIDSGERIYFNGKAYCVVCGPHEAANDAKVSPSVKMDEFKKRMGVARVKR